MVKLLRLTTANNGIFKAEMDAGILIPPGSKLALQNLTFKTNFIPITIDDGDRNITFNGDDARVISHPTSAIPYGSYNGKAGKEAFMIDLENSLNALTSSINSQPAPLGANNRWAQTFSDWSVTQWADDGDPQTSDFNQLGFSYSLLGTPMGPTYNAANKGGTRNGYWFETDVDGTFSIDVDNNKVELADNLDSTTTTKYHMVPTDGFKLSRGSSLWMVRIVDCVPSAISPGGQDNGFGIGLTTDNLADDGFPDSNKEIPDSARQYEIRFNHGAVQTPPNRETYKYREVGFGAVEQDSGIIPQRTQANHFAAHTHDVVWFRVSAANVLGKQNLTCGVWMIGETTGTAGVPAGTTVEKIFFTKQLSRAEQTSGFYPYLYMTGGSTQAHGADNHITQLGAICYTLSNDINWQHRSWIDTLGQGSIRTDYDILDTFRDPNEPTRMGFVTPQLDLNRWRKRPTAQLTLSTNVWKYLGFTEFPNVTVNGYTHIDYKLYWTLSSPNLYLQRLGALWLADNVSILDKNDAFIVESVSIPLDCYDASAVFYGANNEPAPNTVARRGRRKNILMTLPVNDNNNGLVMYDSNTPVFIDIPNTAPLLLKNISFNILTKDWREIVTENNTAIITLLLDTGN
jgi:hypothetical protein